MARRLLNFALGVAMLLTALYMARSEAQSVTTDLTLSEDTPEESVEINIPTGQVQVLRLRVFDADQTAEGELFINERGSITLFGAQGTQANNDIFVDFDITLSTQQRGWFQQGDNDLRFRHLATNGFRITQVIVLGAMAKREFASVMPAVSDAISPQRERALEIYKRLVGVSTGIDNPKLVAMEGHIINGRMLDAAKVATSEAGFYNNVVRDMAAKMSTREETVKAPLSDFVATFIGVTRDNTDARELLNGDMFYMGTVSVAVSTDLLSSVVNTNDHYAALERDGYDLSAVLRRVNNQVLRRSDRSLVNNPDAAGLLTSRAFMEAHAVAGTNRRMVEFTMRQFACSPIDTWADASSSDIRVGRDVDRFPGGEAAKFQTTCKACHANMDGFRGAFAKYDFANNFIKYAAFFTNGNDENTMQLQNNVARKYNQNTNVFPQGYTTSDDTWVNFARSPANEQLFGWRGNVASGAGAKQFGTAVANSRVFSTCMVKRVFRELCRRDPAGFELPVIAQLGTQFENSGYKLKDLFETVAVRPECIGKQ